MKFQKWDILIADVPFEGMPDSKVRPVLVLDGNGYVIVCLKMTSQKPRAGEYVLKKWKEAGLRKETTVRVSKSLQLDPNRIYKRIGRLHPVDIIDLQQLLNRN